MEKTDDRSTPERAQRPRSSDTRVTLPDGATVVVVGGGPAGSFFALHLLRQAKQVGKTIDVIILEKKTEVCFYDVDSPSSWEGCNYCAGGVSPRLLDAFRAEGISLPDDVIESRPTEVIVHADWKSMNLPVPEGREMMSVFRGSRPRQRHQRYMNFDTFLLNLAADEGARVITAEVDDIRYTPDGRPCVGYREVPRRDAPQCGAPPATGDGAAPGNGAAAPAAAPAAPDSAPVDPPRSEIEADLAVIAGGVNRRPGMDMQDDPLLASVRRVIPRFRPPKVRRAVIAEMIDETGRIRMVEGEVHFAQYGSKDLHIEMASVMPKRDWVTVALIGKSIDRADRAGARSPIEQSPVAPVRPAAPQPPAASPAPAKPVKPAEPAAPSAAGAPAKPDAPSAAASPAPATPATSRALAEQFVRLPHIHRLVPHRAELVTRCTCNPNMTIGAAKHPFGHRIALTGDLAISRLYKDGLYSAHITSSALADCVLDEGIDERSLRRGYAHIVAALDRDNRFGRIIFWISHRVLANRALSRILYTAVIRERMGIREDRHRLAPILWQVASGDDLYRRILGRMLHPASLWRIFASGLILRIRDGVTERVFGLDWTGVPRFMTGVPLQWVEQTRNDLFASQGLPLPSEPPHMESMFTMRIRADKDAILEQLGAFGDPDRKYLKPRFVHIRRLHGAPNQVGTVIRYHVPLLRLGFSVKLEEAVPDRYLLYRITDGMGEGGILAFVLNELRPGVNLLSIYVGFDFPKGKGLRRIGWAIGRRLFPEFAHDVIWNHSLCQIRHLAETREG